MCAGAKPGRDGYKESLHLLITASMINGGKRSLIENFVMLKSD